MAKGKELDTADFDAVALLSELGIEGVSTILDAAQEIGDGWKILSDKDDLINVPFVIVNYRFKEGDFYKDGSKAAFGVFHVVTREAIETAGAKGKWIVTDGSTGLCAQVSEWCDKNNIDYTSKDAKPALACSKGLVRSDYTVEGVGDASTYYIAF
jgi:hypothetical protein